jgi:CIC family chloride channel protein
LQGAGGFLLRCLNLSGLRIFPKFTLWRWHGGHAGGGYSRQFHSYFPIAEITGGYALFVPLMVSSSSISYRTSSPFRVYPQARQPGVDVYANRDRGLLAQLDPRQLLDTGFNSGVPNTTLANWLMCFGTPRNLFPVVAAGCWRSASIWCDAPFDDAHYATLTTGARTDSRPPWWAPPTT